MLLGANFSKFFFGKRTKRRTQSPTVSFPPPSELGTSCNYELVLCIFLVICHELHPEVG